MRPEKFCEKKTRVKDKERQNERNEHTELSLYSHVRVPLVNNPLCVPVCVYKL